MSRKRQDSGPPSVDYPAAAILLAESYGNMQLQQEYFNKVLSGETVYTEDDALEELISTTASTESDTGIRVQSSSISNTTERIGMLLANGFVDKRNREILRDVLNDTENRLYLAWKLDVVNTAKAERMNRFERALFERLFVRHRTYRQIREAYKGKKLHDRDINDARKSILAAIADEVELRDDGCAEEGAYIEKLTREVRIAQEEKE